MKICITRLGLLLCQFLVGGLLVYSAVWKLQNMSEFAAALPVALRHTVPVFGWLLLPSFELVLGLHIIACINLRQAFEIAGGIFVCFSIYHGFVFWYGLGHQCKCFVIRNIEFSPLQMLSLTLFLSIVCFYARWLQKKMSPNFTHETSH